MFCTRSYLSCYPSLPKHTVSKKPFPLKSIFQREKRGPVRSDTLLRNWLVIFLLRVCRVGLSLRVVLRFGLYSDSSGALSSGRVRI